jgi:hypothetical protein
MALNSVYAKSAPIFRPRRILGRQTAIGIGQRKQDAIEDELDKNRCVCIILTLLLSLAGAVVGILYALEELI